MFRAPKRSLHTAYGHQQPADGAGAIQDAEEPGGLDGVFWKGGTEVVVAVSSAEASFRGPFFQTEQDSVVAETEEAYGDHEPAECFVPENIGVNPGF